MRVSFRNLQRPCRDERGAVAMSYVVMAVLLVAAVVAIVLVFSGVLGDGFGTSGRAAAGQVAAAAESAAAARENFEVAQVRAVAAQQAIQGGELLFGDPSGDWPDKEEEDENGVKHPVAVEIGHTVLDLAGLIPGIGDAVDLANAAWYEKDGRHVEAAITAAAAVPVAGTAAVVVKWGNNAAKLAKVVFKDGKIVKVITQEGKVLTKEGGKIAKETGKTGGKASETTVSKNADNVVDLSKKRAEKTGTPDNVIDASDGFGKVAKREKTVETTRIYKIEKETRKTGDGTVVETSTVKIEDVQNNTVYNKVDGPGSNPFQYVGNESSYPNPVEPVSPPSKTGKVNQNTKNNGQTYQKTESKTEPPAKNGEKTVEGNAQGENDVHPTTENLEAYRQNQIADDAIKYLNTEKAKNEYPKADLSEKGNPVPESTGNNPFQGNVFEKFQEFKPEKP